MKCNVIINVDYVKVSIVNNSDWVSVADVKYADTNSTVTIPLEYLSGADDTCVTASMGTITGNVLTIPVTTYNVTVVLSNAKCLVSVSNNDATAVQSIIPSQQFVTFGNTGTFAVEYNDGYSSGSSKTSVGTFSGSSLSVPVNAAAARLNVDVTPNMHNVTITNTVPYVVTEFNSTSVRHFSPLSCDIVYGESSDYTCIRSTTGTIGTQGLVINQVTDDISLTIVPNKVQVKTTNNVPYHITSISPEIQYVTPGQTAQVVMTYLRGYDHSDLYTTSGTISNNILSIATSSAHYYVTAVLFRGVDSTVEIATESTISNNTLPVNIYYNYSLTQQLYKASELGGSGNLKSIAFRRIGSASDTRKIEIYLENVDASLVSGFTSIANATKVFNGNVTFTGDSWTTIPFSTQFGYDGSKNLMVTVHDYTGSYSERRSFAVYNKPDGINSSRTTCTDSGDFNMSQISSISGGQSSVHTNSIKLVMTQEIEDTPEPEPVPTVIEIGQLTETDTIHEVAHVPSNVSYKYFMSEQIYLAREIGESGTITDIALYHANNSAFTRNWDIYLVPVDISQFPNNNPYYDDQRTDVIIHPTSSDLVYSGPVEFPVVGSSAKGWKTIHLDTPFAYDGIQNLCLIIYDRTGTNMTSAHSFKSAKTPDDNRVALHTFGMPSRYPDGTQVDPKDPNIVTIANLTRFRNFIQISIIPES
jgi:hypothetical protein